MQLSYVLDHRRPLHKRQHRSPLPSRAHTTQKPHQRDASAVLPQHAYIIWQNRGSDIVDYDVDAVSVGKPAHLGADIGRGSVVYGFDGGVQGRQAGEFCVRGGGYDGSDGGGETEEERGEGDTARALEEGGPRLGPAALGQREGVPGCYACCWEGG